MKEYRIRPLVVALAVGTAAAVITMTSGCSSTPPSLRPAPYVPPMPVVEQVIPVKSAMMELANKIPKYSGAGRCAGGANELASEDSTELEALIEHLEDERDDAGLFCLGTILADLLDDKRLAKSSFFAAFGVADNIVDDIVRIYGRNRSPKGVWELPKGVGEELEEAQDIQILAATARGSILLNEKNYEAALRPRSLSFAAVNGNPTAQNNLAFLYTDPNISNPFSSRREANRWFFRAAQQGHYPSLSNLAFKPTFENGGEVFISMLTWALLGQPDVESMLESGATTRREKEGDSETLKDALMWAMIAQHNVESKLKSGSATRREKEEEKLMEVLIKQLEKRMTDYQVSEAERSKNEYLGRGKTNWIGGGSGFYVNDHGHILTNEHVVYRNGKECDYVSVMSPTDNFPRFISITNKVDASLDLAILYDPDHKEREVPDSGLQYAKLRNQKSPPAPGEYVIVTGFPLDSKLALEMHTTTGVVVASSGIGSDHRHFVFSAPIQNGNSGGPVLDANGNAIGVAFAGTTGDVENMNHAINLEQVRGFLDKNQVSYEEATLSSPIDNNGLAGAPIVDKSGRQVTPLVSKQAQGYTVLVECWMSAKE